MRNTLSVSWILPVALLLCLAFGCQKQEERAAVGKEKVGEDLQLDKIPQVVMGGLTARFPDAEIHEWTVEKEGDIVVYDIEFVQAGRKFEADIKEDGTIHNWEKAIEAASLPEAVKKAAATKYPGSAMKEIMETTVVIDGKDVLAEYEIVLETTENEEVEITLAPSGEIIENSGDEHQEEK